MKKLVLVSAMLIGTLPTMAASFHTSEARVDLFNHHAKAERLAFELEEFARRYEGGSHGERVAHEARKMLRAAHELREGLRHHRHPHHVRSLVRELDSKVNDFARVAPLHAGNHARHILHEIHEVLRQEL